MIEKEDEREEREKEMDNGNEKSEYDSDLDQDPSQQVTGKDNDLTEEVIDKSGEEKWEGEGGERKSDDKENEGGENGED